MNRRTNDSERARARMYCLRLDDDDDDDDDAATAA